MTDEDKTKQYGRTWADVFAQTSYLFAGFFFLVIAAIIIYFVFDRMPQWFFWSVAGSLIFIPFLIERAKEKSNLFVILDEPMKMSEYRVGKKYNFKLEGNPVRLTSKTGIVRSLLMDFDNEKRLAKALPFAELTPLDQMRELKTNLRLSTMFEEHLRETRISSQEVGIAVEKQSIEIVDWALKTIYGAIIPTEISEAFGIKDEKATLEVLTTEEEILEDVE